MSSNARWRSVIISLDKKEYKIKNPYDELLQIFGVEFITGTTGFQLRIKNIGVIVIKYINLYPFEGKMILKCARME